MPRAALFGILAAGAASTSFGAEAAPQFGGASQFGATWPPSPSFGAGGAYQASYGGTGGHMVAYGADAAPATYPTTGAPLAAPNPNNPAHHQALMSAWYAQQGKVKKTNERLALLSPNNGSDVDVEAYIFSLNASVFTVGTALVWGTPTGWTAFKNPQTAFRAENLKVNVNQPGVMYLNAIQTANVNAQVGAVADAYTFSAISNGARVSLPTLPPQNTLQVTGTWTNVTPVPFTPGQQFISSLDFLGWATVTPT
jgi:hypothetical protein